MGMPIDQQPALDVATTWRIDPAASRVTFTIRTSLAVVIPQTPVVGRFADVSGTIILHERRPASARIEVAIGAASLATGSAERDAQLRGAEGFDVERHPTLTFASRMVEEVERAGGRYRIMGDLTIRSVTRAVRMDLVLARGQDAAGQPQVVINAETVINRRDYGIAWNGLLVRAADDIAVTLAITAQPAAGGQNGHV